MKRRAFICTLGMALLCPPLAVGAQSGRVYRLGYLTSVAPPVPAESATSIEPSLRELGYVEGQNLVVERRYARGRVEQLPALARELVQLRMEVIVAVGTSAIRAVKEATTTIPIVMYGGVDPVATGLVTSLARPGGNVTGILIAAGNTLGGKRLELLKETVPQAARIAFLAVDDPGFRPQVREAKSAAATLGITLVVAEVRGGDYDRAFATMLAERSGALCLGASPFFYRDRRRIIELAAKHRLPTMYEWPEQVKDGGLMAYGPSQSEFPKRVASYVDRVFKGAKPGDLPIEQPTKFELAINLKTAKALGLTVPPSLLARADQVIE
ncbi:MAG TPA: ABC transporter substrate-binding protein [Candidatus Eisenbacteria bacterium]|nr:ABC transporter substrate-binding protein [Candidatus Eisenbacteria bacterium]